MRESKSKDQKNLAQTILPMAGYVLGVAVGTLLGVGVLKGDYTIPVRGQPEIERLSEDRINPNDLEFVVSDLDEDGNVDVSVTYQENSYLCVKGEDGRPTFVPYEITSPKIVRGK